MPAELTFELALSRYRNGKCPRCGRGLGDTRGLEYRTRIGDLYCHTCKTSWPTEMNVTNLQDRLALTESPEPEMVFPLAEKEASRATVTTSRLTHFFRRVALLKRRVTP